MAAARKLQPVEPTRLRLVEDRLDDGTYDAMLAAFRREMAAARAALREYQMATAANDGPLH